MANSGQQETTEDSTQPTNLQQKCVELRQWLIHQGAFTLFYLQYVLMPTECNSFGSYAVINSKDIQMDVLRKLIVSPTYLIGIRMLHIALPMVSNVPIRFWKLRYCYQTRKRRHETLWLNKLTSGLFYSLWLLIQD